VGIGKVPAAFLGGQLPKEPGAEERQRAQAVTPNGGAQSTQQADRQQAQSAVVIKGRRMENEFKLIPPVAESFEHRRCDESVSRIAVVKRDRNCVSSQPVSGMEFDEFLQR
jgi:hypothetical protein